MPEDEPFWMYYSARLDAFLRVCGQAHPEAPAKCLRAYEHDGWHMTQDGTEWAPETTETTDTGKR